MVGHIAVIINTPGVEPGSAHLPPSPRNQDHLRVWDWPLDPNVPLDQWNAPMFLNALAD